jgi:plasmid stabilization system protein ParE
MRLRYTKPALADLDSILQFIAERSPQGATRVHARIEAVLDLLLMYPRIGVQTEDPTVRRINATPYPYLVFYEVADSEIVVHAIHHGARNPSTMPGTKS